MKYKKYGVGIGWGLGLLCLFYAVGVWGWPHDFKGTEEINIYNGISYIDTTGTGLLMISAPLDTIAEGRGGTAFSDTTIPGVEYEALIVEPQRMQLNNKDRAIERFTTTTNRGDRTTARWVTQAGGGVSLEFAEPEEWQEQETPVNRDLLDVEFITKDVGWIAGGEGSAVLIHTTDGGETWIDVVDRLPEGARQSKFNDIDFKTPAIAWAAGANGTIITTQDSGNTWTLLPKPRTSEGDSLTELTSLTFTSLTKGWVTGRSGLIAHTEDGGYTWTPQVEEIFYDFNDMTMIDSLRGVAVGEQGLIMKTDNGGERWVPVTADVSATLHEVTTWRYGSITYIWICGDGGNVLRTTSGGTSWDITTVEDAGNLYAISKAIVHGEINGWICSESGSVLHTTNRGDTWELHDTGTFESLLDIGSKAATGALQQEGVFVWGAGERGTVLFNPLYNAEDVVYSSNEFIYHSTPITSVTLTVDDDDLGGIGNITYFVSNNLGFDWVQVDENYHADFSTVGNTMMWKAILETSDQDFSPAIYEVQFDYIRGYDPYGRYTSPIYFEDTQLRRFRDIEWESDTPPGTSIRLDLLDNEDRLIRSVYVDERGRDTLGFDNREVYYKLHFNTSDLGETPVLESLNIRTGFTNRGVAKPYNAVTAANVEQWDEVIIGLGNYDPAIHGINYDVLAGESVVIDLPPANVDLEEGRITIDVSSLSPDDDLNVRLELETSTVESSPEIDYLNITYLEHLDYIHPGDIEFMGEGFLNAADDHCFNRDLFIQLVDDTLTVNKTTDPYSLPAKLYSISDPPQGTPPVMDVTLYMVDPNVSVPNDNRLRYYRAEVSWNQIVAELDPAVGDMFRIVYTDLKDGDENDYNNDKIAEVPIVDCDVYPGDIDFMREGFITTADDHCFNHDLFVQLVDDTLTVNKATNPYSLDTKLYLITDPPQNTPPVMDVTLSMVDPGVSVPADNRLRYYRAQVSWNEIVAALDPAIGDILRIVYIDLNDGDENDNNNDKIAEVPIVDCSQPPQEDSKHFIVYPNPFKKIVWDVGYDADLPTFEVLGYTNFTLKIFNIAAELVREVDESVFTTSCIAVRPEGARCYVWDLKNDHGEFISSGTYFAVLEQDSGSEPETVKLVVVR